MLYTYPRKELADCLEILKEQQLILHRAVKLPLILEI